ncbi:hypothetical protein [Streptomyces sp. ME19-01-6]|uniref:hypothetical protein n=1 Tax=Streptomyces sp. ME19-01-6 TaxID=3028686 RepID=UPI0029B1230F|nr:hypothetical protein [Streptomyces sp. ME19-01-6]MDX3227181.1 hypothetical protein [Streptomyces sp. ME19-01-6]
MEPAALIGGVVALLVLGGLLNALRGRRPWSEPTYVPLCSVAPTVEEDTRTDELLDELAAIARSRGFLRQGREDPRTREIGAELDRMNGMQKMRDVHRVVAAELGGVHARELEVAWDGIGGWQG